MLIVHFKMNYELSSTLDFFAATQRDNLYRATITKLWILAVKFLHSMMPALRGKFLLHYWALYMIIMAIYMYQSKKQDYKNSEKVVAAVIDRIEINDHWHRHYQYPQFQFTYNDSIYISADQLTWTRGKEPGDKVAVIFPKGKPEEAIIYTFVSYWIYLPALLISFMVAIFIFAALVFVKW